MNTELRAHGLEQALADFLPAVFHGGKPLPEIQPAMTALAMWLKAHSLPLPATDPFQSPHQLIPCHGVQYRTFMYELQERNIGGLGGDNAEGAETRRRKEIDNG